MRPSEPDAAPRHEVHPSLANSPGHLLWRATLRVQTALAEVVPPGVDVHGYAVLLALGDDRPRSQQELADAVATSRTTLARVAAHLVDRGLVERVRNPADRRSYALTRTPSGARAAAAWRAHAEALEARLTGSLDDGDRADLHRLLRRLAAPGLSRDVPDDLPRSIAFLLTRVHGRLHREFGSVLEPLRLEPRLFAALAVLRADGPIAQSDLARALGISGAATVQIVDLLEERGFVERRRDPADRRHQRLHLLTGAPEVVARAKRLAPRLETFAVLDDDDRAGLVRHLARFVTAP